MSTADEGSRSLSNVGLPRTDWESLFGAGLRAELAFPILTIRAVVAVVELRSASGLPISDTLTRVLESVGREVGAFFAVRPCLDRPGCRHLRLPHGRHRRSVYCPAVPNSCCHFVLK